MRMKSFLPPPAGRAADECARLGRQAAALALLVFLASPFSAWADTITVVQPLAFGNILADPAGDHIQVDTTHGFLPYTTEGASAVTGGSIGIIRITSGVGEDGRNVSMSYPANILMTFGGYSMRVDQIIEHSTVNAVTVLGDVDIYVGGRLEISREQRPGPYSGSITVIINYP